MEPAAAWRPVGTVLVDNGSITTEQLEAALSDQRRTGRKIGEILIDSGAITWLTLAHAIAEQASDLDGSNPAPTVAAKDESESVQIPSNGTSAEERLQTVEALLRDRQRAFLELVSVTETLRATVVRLQEQLASRDGELMRLRAESVSH